MQYNLHFFSSKCRLFHNATLFGFCITHIVNTGCAKIWKKVRRQKVKLVKHADTSNLFCVFISEFFYPSLFPSVIVTYPLMLSPLLFSPPLPTSVLCLYYPVFPSVFPSYVLMTCTCVISSSPLSFLLWTSSLYPSKSLVLFFFLTQYGTVPPEVYRSSSLQPHRFITKPTSQKKK